MALYKEVLLCMRKVKLGMRYFMLQLGKNARLCIGIKEHLHANVHPEKRKKKYQLMWIYAELRYGL